MTNTALAAPCLGEGLSPSCPGNYQTGYTGPGAILAAACPWPLNLRSVEPLQSWLCRCHGQGVFLPSWQVMGSISGLQVSYHIHRQSRLAWWPKCSVMVNKPLQCLICSWRRLWTELEFNKFYLKELLTFLSNDYKISRIPQCTSTQVHTQNETWYNTADTTRNS